YHAGPEADSGEDQPDLTPGHHADSNRPPAHTGLVDDDPGDELRRHGGQGEKQREGELVGPAGCGGEDAAVPRPFAGGISLNPGRTLGKRKGLGRSTLQGPVSYGCGGPL